MASYILLEQARYVEALVLDVDGILSDGFVTLTNSGDEIKSFDIRDGLGMKLVQQAGVKVIIITGRKSQIVEKRMSDLGVDLVYQQCQFVLILFVGCLFYNFFHFRKQNMFSNIYFVLHFLALKK